MSEFFVTVFNMSISASWIVLAVLLFRFVLKKAPKWINCVLWGIAGLRLIMPFSFESIFFQLSKRILTSYDYTATTNRENFCFFF